MIVTTDGLPLAYEVFPGNTLDKAILKPFLEKIEKLYGKARRVWVMDRGNPTEATLEEMREEGVAYLVGTPRSLLSKLERELVDRPWEQVHDGVQVKLLGQENELYVLARRADRRKKEAAIRRRKLKTLIHGLNRLKPRRISRDTLLKKLAVLQRDAGRVAGLVKIREPKVGEPVNRQTFVCRFDRPAWRRALDRDGCYMLRAYLPPEGKPEVLTWEKKTPVLWAWYTQLVQAEEAFKTVKSDLDLRPVHHQMVSRVEGHIFVAFLAYCLTVTLRMKLNSAAPGLTIREVLRSLGAIQLVDVHIPTTDGRELVMPRYTEPEVQQEMILEKPNLKLPKQPLPRMRSGEVIMPTAPLRTRTDTTQMIVNATAP